jgi:hypothetical protein
VALVNVRSRTRSRVMRQIVNLMPVFGQWLSLLLCMACAIITCASRASVVLRGVISSAVWTGPNRASHRFKRSDSQGRHRGLAWRAEQDEAPAAATALVGKDEPGSAEAAE